MNPTRSVALVALAFALPLLFAACGNKGPLVRATPVPATIDGTPTIDAPVEGETAPAEDAAADEPTVEESAVEDTDPSDEITLPEDEPTPEPAPEPVPPDGTANG